MAGRREDLLDAAIRVLGGGGIRALTHRAVDAAAGLPTGSASNHFRTRDALLNAVVQRFAERERANWDELAVRMNPATPRELAVTMIAYVREATGTHRTLTLARYAILVEAANQPALRAQLLATGARVNAWFINWLRVAGSTDPERDAPLLMNHATGLILHQLAMPDPAFDPAGQLTNVITDVIRPRPVADAAEVAT